MSTDSDYRAWVEVLPEFRRFNEAVEAGVVGGLAGAGSSGAAAMGGGLVAGIGRFAVPLVGAIAALGIGSAITSQIQQGMDAGIAYASNAVNGAAALEQSVGAVTAIFKESSDQILTWGDSAATAVGLSRNSYFEFAARVGAQLKNLGIPMSDVAGQTNDLIGLGADLAATYGGPTSDAVAALSSLLRGERDPIERYGVSIKQADVNARVAAMGLGELTLEQQRQAEIMATLAILSEQTADAQGRFAAEEETFLGVQQRINAQLEETATAFGEQLLPIVSEAMTFVKDELLPIWIEANRELGPAMREALAEAMPTIKELAERILPLIPPAIEWVIASIRWFIETIDGNLRWLNIWSGVLNDIFALLKGDISIDQFVANFVARVSEWREVVDARIAEIKQAFVQFGTDIAGVVYAIARNLYLSGRAMIQQFIDGIKSMLRPLADAVGGVMDFVRGFFPSSPAQRGPFSGPGWTDLAKSGSAIMDQFRSGLEPVEVPLTANLDWSTMDSPRRAQLATEAADARSMTGATVAEAIFSDEQLDKLARAIARETRLTSRMGVDA